MTMTMMMMMLQIGRWAGQKLPIDGPIKVIQIVARIRIGLHPNLSIDYDPFWSYIILSRH